MWSSWYSLGTYLDQCAYYHAVRIALFEKGEATGRLNPNQVAYLSVSTSILQVIAFPYIRLPYLSEDNITSLSRHHGYCKADIIDIVITLDILPMTFLLLSVLCSDHRSSLMLQYLDAAEHRSPI
jgi:hypothetical protein